MEKVQQALPVENIKIAIKHESEKSDINIPKRKAGRNVFKHDHAEKDVKKNGIRENKFIFVVLFLQFSFFC